MRRDVLFAMVLATLLAAPGMRGDAWAAPKGEADREEFDLHAPDEASRAETAKHAKIKPTLTQAALRFFLIDKEKGPIKGTVIALTAPDGTKYYTEETDGDGYAEVLVPIGQKYDIVYLSLGRREIAAQVTVKDLPKQSIKLTLRYQGPPPPPPIIVPTPPARRFILDGVNFDTGKATLRPESMSRLDFVAEIMEHKKGMRIEISGHTDNVGKKKDNQQLSDRRAKSCRDYLVSKGIDASRITTVGYGDQRPIAPNDDEQGRQRNRRIEATEL